MVPQFLIVSEQLPLPGFEIEDENELIDRQTALEKTFDGDEVPMTRDNLIMRATAEGSL